MKPHSPLIIYIMLTRYSIILYFIQIHKMIRPDQRRYIIFFLFYFSISLQQPATLQTNLIYKNTGSYSNKNKQSLGKSERNFI